MAALMHPQRWTRPHVRRPSPLGSFCFSPPPPRTCQLRHGQHVALLHLVARHQLKHLGPQHHPRRGHRRAHRVALLRGRAGGGGGQDEPAHHVPADGRAQSTGGLSCICSAQLDMQGPQQGLTWLTSTMVARPLPSTCVRPAAPLSGAAAAAAAAAAARLLAANARAGLLPARDNVAACAAAVCPGAPVPAASCCASDAAAAALPSPCGCAPITLNSSALSSCTSGARCAPGLLPAAAPTAAAEGAAPCCCCGAGGKPKNSAISRLKSSEGVELSQRCCAACSAAAPAQLCGGRGQTPGARRARAAAAAAAAAWSRVHWGRCKHEQTVMDRQPHLQACCTRAQAPRLNQGAQQHRTEAMRRSGGCWCREGRWRESLWDALQARRRPRSDAIRGTKLERRPTEAELPQAGARSSRAFSADRQARSQACPRPAAAS